MKTYFDEKIKIRNTVRSKMKNLLSPKEISSKQLLNDFSSKNVTSTKILPKMNESKFP